MSKENRLKFIQLNSLQQDSLESAMQNTMNVERNHINISQRLEELTKHDLVTSNNVFVKSFHELNDIIISIIIILHDHY